VLRDVDIHGAVQRVITSSEPAAAAKSLRLTAAADGAPATLHTDPMRLEQILVNLLSNAIRHSPERASVEVRVDASEGNVAFSVIDHGPGVPVELRQRIFEPFERFDPHSGIGTGLGLPVSRRLAEALGGTLVVEETPGGGATFIVKIPSASL
jgi:two-component system sensor histidine kinase KdpD